MNKLINFIGLQRCGTHAVANWIIHQSENAEKEQHPTHFHDDVWYYDWGSFTCGIMFNSRFPHNPEIGYNHLKKIKEYLGNPTVDVCLLCYECSLVYMHYDCKAEPDLYETDRKNFQSNNEQTVILLRDVKNCFASFYKKYGHVPQHIIGHWEARANEILGKTKNVPNHVFLNYNKWFIDKKYRQQLCNDLSLYFTDIGKSQVPNFGGGSSFSGRQADGNASSMDVLTRFRNFDKNAGFQRTLQTHKHLVELSDEIFGEM
jgi:hypothetical protein